MLWPDTQKDTFCQVDVVTVVTTVHKCTLHCHGKLRLATAKVKRQSIAGHLAFGELVLVPGTRKAAQHKKRLEHAMPFVVQHTRCAFLAGAVCWFFSVNVEGFSFLVWRSLLLLCQSVFTYKKNNTEKMMSPLRACGQKPKWMYNSRRYAKV